jgi:outer membrane murein-binding lipoprotein Lpp
MSIRSGRAVTGLSVFGLGAMLMLTGCDFWPPALQAQIEQLRSEAQQAAADKALLQNQLNAANKAKEELQIHVEDLTRVNKEKSAMIANLERTLAAARERTVKATKSGMTKPATKAAVKKAVPSASKPAAKSTRKPVGPKKIKPAPVKPATR